MPRRRVRYQIQEMMRIARIVKPADVQNEIDTYNELVPARGEFSVSLPIEYETPAERALNLPMPLGLDRHIWIEAAGERVPVRLDARQIGETRLSSVQYIKFTRTPAQMAAWPEGASIVVDHWHYQAARALTAAEREELTADFAPSDFTRSHIISRRADVTLVEADVLAALNRLGLWRSWERASMAWKRS